MYDFYKEQTMFDQIMLISDDKLIRKIYVSFKLENGGQTSQINDGSMGNIFGYNIDFEKWQKLWSRNYKMTMAASYKENLYKMFYRWHLPPNRLLKCTVVPRKTTTPLNDESA